MLNTFANNQDGGVSPQFAIFMSTVFIAIGGGLYLGGDTVYSLFDDMLAQIKYAVKL